MGCSQSHRKDHREKGIPEQKVLITSELSPKELLLERKVSDKRYKLIKIGIDRSRLRIKKLKLCKTNELVEVN